MKWIRRKPSVWVQIGTMVACALVLFSLGSWTSGPLHYQGSTVGWWLHEKTIGRNLPIVYRLRSSCFVIEVEGRVRMLGDGDLPSQEVWREHQRHLYQYLSFSTRIGFFAPTSTRIRHRLFKSPGDHSSYPFVSQAFSEQGWRTLTPQDTGFMERYLSLAQRSWIYEDRPIWSGYAINTGALLTVLVLVWSLTWVPRSIRHHIRRKRSAAGLCPVCEYDVRATPGRCPECGWGHEDEGNGDVSGGNGA